METPNTQRSLGRQQHYEVLCIKIRSGSLYNYALRHLSRGPMEVDVVLKAAFVSRLVTHMARIQLGKRER